jgi:hypothetical protein
MTRALSQFVYCWSAHGLFGTGYGVRAATSDLLQLTREDWGRYVAFCDYLPEADRQRNDFEQTAPLCLARYRLPDGGYLIVRKAPGGRRGTYFVHAVIDADGAIDSTAIVASSDASFWLEADDGLEPGETLPALDADAWLTSVPEHVAPGGETARDLAAFAAANAEGAVTRISGVGRPVLPRIAALLRLLPEALAAGICFSTYEAGERTSALDLVADDEAVPGPEPNEWMSRLVELGREAPDATAALRGDERVRTLADLAEAVEAVTAPVAAAALTDAVASASPFLPELLRRPGAAEAVVDAIDAAPQAWGRGDLGGVDLAALLGGPEAVLALAAGRLGDRPAAAKVFAAAYGTARPDLDSRLRDLQASAAGMEADDVTELALLLLGDQSTVDAATAHAWQAVIRPRWTRMAELMRTTRPGLQAAVVRGGLFEGAGDGPPRLPGDAAHLVVDAVADAATVPGLERRAAAFLVGFAVGRECEHEILLRALERLAPGFVRGPLADRLVDEHYRPDEAVRAALQRAGLADAEAFRLLTEPAAVAPEREAPRRRRGLAALFRRR